MFPSTPSVFGDEADASRSSSAVFKNKAEYIMWLRYDRAYLPLITKAHATQHIPKDISSIALLAKAPFPSDYSMIAVPNGLGTIRCHCHVLESTRYDDAWFDELACWSFTNNGMSKAALPPSRGYLQFLAYVGLMMVLYYPYSVSFVQLMWDDAILQEENANIP